MSKQYLTPIFSNNFIPAQVVRKWEGRKVGQNWMGDYIVLGIVSMDLEYKLPKQDMNMYIGYKFSP